MSGKSFGGCVRYVTGKQEAVILEASGVRAGSASRMISDFNMQRKLNPELGKAVGHIALSWHLRDREKLNPSLMKQHAKEYMEKMKITDTQYLIVLHQDREHPHLHIVYNRVSHSGKTISDQFQRQRNVKVCKELTTQYGYYLAKDKQEVNRKQLRGADQVKYELHDTIIKVIRQCRNWKDLEEKLRLEGIATSYKYKSGSTEVQGVSFGKGDYSFKGSEIDRSLSYGRIEKTLQQNRELNQVHHPSFHQQSQYNYDNQQRESSYQQNAWSFSNPNTNDNQNPSQLLPKEQTEAEESTAIDIITGTGKALLDTMSLQTGAFTEDEDELRRKKKKKRGLYR